MYEEDDLVPLSGVAQFAYCERRCALIHIEQAWSENRFTAEGRQLHERTHAPDTEARDGVRIARGVRLRSLRLGLAGQADVVEFAPSPDGCELPGLPGRWQPYPVEYKRGKPKAGNCDVVQLCAQALCLEETLGVAIPEGALYYGKPRRRTEVVFSEALRGETAALAERLHALIRSGTTPPPTYTKACRSCSLVDLCMPKAADRRRSARAYVELLLADEGGGQ